MKTYILFILFIAGLFISLNAQTGIHTSKQSPQTECCGILQLYTPSKAFAVDSVICDKWDYMNNKFIPYALTVNTYDGNGRMIESVSGYYYSAGVYRNSVKYTFTYSQFDSVLTRTDYFWNDTLNVNGDWDNSRLYEYSYDNYKRISVVKVSYSPFGTLNWLNNTREYWTYGMNGLLDNIATEYWAANENVWKDYMRYRFVYDQSYDLVERYTDYSNNGIFENSLRIIYNHNQSDDNLDILWQTFSQNNWNNYKRELHSMNDLGFSELVLKESWNQSEMIWDTLFRERDYYEYDSHGNITDHIYQSSYIEWFNISREMYVYDIYGNIIESSEFEWNHNTDYWDQTRRCIYKTTSSLLSVYSDDQVDFNVFPNPTNGYLNVVMNKSQDYDEINISLISASGQLIKRVETNNVNEILIKLTDYDYGTYFLELEINGISRVVKKIIYQ